MLDDIKKASADDLSFADASLEIFQMDHTVRYPELGNDYGLDVIRGPLTRGFPARFDDIKDEIAASFSDIIPEKDGEFHAMHDQSSLLELSFPSFAGRPIDYSSGYRFVSDTRRSDSLAVLTGPDRQKP
jgi:hypothetical protein